MQEGHEMPCEFVIASEMRRHHLILLMNRSTMFAFSVADAVIVPWLLSIAAEGMTTSTSWAVSNSRKGSES